MHQQVTKGAGLLYVVTALVSGYWGLRAMFAPVPDAPFFWLPMVIFSSPILLLVGGLLALFPQLGKKWLVALAGIILLVFWAAFFRDSSKLYLVFAAVVMLTTWGVLGLASKLGKPAVVAFIASVTLALIWLQGAVALFRSTLSVIPPVSNALASAIANGPLLVLWAFIIAASVLSGVATFRRSQP